MEMGYDHCQIVTMTLQGTRPVDDQTAASMAVLNERLERLKHLSGAFSGISFSEHAEELIGPVHAVGVN